MPFSYEMPHQHREALCALGRLVASVSHIFRTHQSLPIGVLQGLSGSFCSLLFEIGSQVGCTGLKLTMWLSLA